MIGRKAGYGAPLREKNASAAPNFGTRAALLAIRLYKANFSLWFGGSCRFQPTCSQYTYEAVEKFGALRGSWLGLKRLLRCHPFSGRFGFDPVPENREEMNASQTARHGEAHS